MERYKILVVDDIEDNRFTLDIMLSVLGEFTVDEAESGSEALSKIANTHYDLVLLDIMMPGMSGIEVLEKLDLLKTKLATKFIVVSALQDMEVIVKALELGALDYLPKPIEEALLAARIKQLLERRETEYTLHQNRLRIDADLKRAAEIQQSLCPTTVLTVTNSEESPHYELAGCMHPAYEVGGDFYDYFQMDNGNIVLVIADACGKGAPAAIYATRVHDLIRMESKHQSAELKNDASSSLSAMLSSVNAMLSDNNDACWFVTTWVAIYSPKERQLYWCSAGHCEALLQRSDNTIEPLTSEVGLPLGLDSVFTAHVASRVLEPGSRVYTYTDGITEHKKSDGEYLGQSGLIQLLENAISNELSATDALKNLASEILELNPDQAPDDDVTIALLST